MKNQNGFTLMELLIVVFFFVGVLGVGGYGWVENIIKISHVVNDPVTGMLILRAVGVFVVPLGMVMGYM